jgi:hypothetical protein
VIRRAFAVALLFLGVSLALAGSACEERPLSPRALAEASRLGVVLYRVLEDSGAELAILGRAGADLGDHGLAFSHAGLAVRVRGRWSVVHLLNRCATDRSALYDEGLVNFFLDNPHRYEVVVGLPTAELAASVHGALAGGLARRLHEPRYNMIAHPRSLEFQNSNQWLVELMVAALAGGLESRAAVQGHPLLESFQPDIIHVGLGERIGGGLFRANVTFLDHPFADRARGEYRTVTVRSVFRWLARTGRLARLLRLDAYSPPQVFSGAGLAAAVENL